MNTKNEILILETKYDIMMIKIHDLQVEAEQLKKRACKLREIEEKNKAKAMKRQLLKLVNRLCKIDDSTYIIPDSIECQECGGCVRVHGFVVYTYADGCKFGEYNKFIDDCSKMVPVDADVLRDKMLEVNGNLMEKVQMLAKHSSKKKKS